MEQRYGESHKVCSCVNLMSHNTIHTVHLPLYGSYGASKMIPNDPHLLLFMTLCNPFPLSAGLGTTSNKWNIVNHDRLDYRKTLILVWGILLPPPDLSFKDSSCPVVSCPKEKPTW